MSTKSSIQYGQHFHVYHECFDDANVYLEITNIRIHRYYRGQFTEFEFSVDEQLWRNLHLHKIPLGLGQNVCVQRPSEIPGLTRVTFVISSADYNIEPDLTQITIILPQSLYRDITLEQTTG